MRTRLLSLWERLRASYWFLPALMAAGAVALAFGTEALDRTLTFEVVEDLRWIYGGGPEGARAVLSAIAGSMITVAGVVFSITMVALVLASSQFGPRLLGNFMKDTGNQVVLGIFIATFLYCLLALRTVRGVEGAQFVPHISITVGLVFGLASIGVLIYFIDHVAASIQAPSVVARVGGDLDAAVDRAFPKDVPPDVAESPGSAEGQGGLPDPGGRTPAGPIVRSERSGYVQAVDEDGLVSVAARYDLVLELLASPGDFLLREAGLVRLGATERPREEEMEALVRSVRGAFLLGDRRTPGQDPRFLVLQLAEVAVRSLSPGVNDPFTAMNCVDRLGAALSEVARRPPPPARRPDGEGRARLLLRPVTFADLASDAFDPIREYGRDSTMVLARLLETLAGIGRNAERREDRDELLRHAERVLASGRKGVPEESGRDLLGRRFEAARRVLEEASYGSG